MKVKLFCLLIIVMVPALSFAHENHNEKDVGLDHFKGLHFGVGISLTVDL